MASETPAGSLPPTSAEPVFRARGLGKVYRMGDVQVTALRDVDLDIRRGEFVVLLGPSGSGKSTLFRLLFRMFDPTSGVIRIDGQDIHKATFASLREKLGVIPQDTILFNDTVMHNTLVRGVQRPLRS